MISGTVVPLITPYDGHGRVSEKSTASLIEYVHADVSALMPVLSSGEGWRLTDQQWSDMVSFTVAHSHGLPVIAGVQAADTPCVLRRARMAEALGADMVAATTPFGAGVGQDEMVAHYRTLQGGTRLPIVVYNEEPVSQNRASLVTLLRICDLPGVAAVKESSGKAELTRALVAAGTGVPVFQGWEDRVASTPAVDGLIGPLANLEPGLCNTLLADPGEPLQRIVVAVCELFGLFRDDWYLRVKRELARRGVIEDECAPAGEEDGS
ncbi:dihydrodipicolinate synthase family protein [Nocardiopsis chromatogenes]|uniref:dihydrodipicolinate synthase family protein n=1 Tax=Nocardiopsis chromatogenes TaxID=280239 RepID=UPI000344B163|nr:dihydrodipicolinate synthase family protein [Nocardiopsis chromatogenes]